MEATLVFEGKLLRKPGNKNFGKGKLLRSDFQPDAPDVIFIRSRDQVNIDEWGSSVWPYSCKCQENGHIEVCGFGCCNDQGFHYKACPECGVYSRWDSHCGNCDCRMLYSGDNTEDEQSVTDEEEEDFVCNVEDCICKYGGKNSPASGVPAPVRN